MKGGEMKRDGKANRLFASLAVSLAIVVLAACGDDGGDDDDDTCAGVANPCGTAGTRCAGDAIIECSANADGCLVESTTDCTTGGQVCDDSTGTAACVDDSCDDVECDGASDGDSFCTGDDATTCDDDGTGCLVATVVDCTAGGQVCDDAGGTAACVDDSCDDVECDGASDGDSFCTGDDAITCDDDGTGCLVATVVDCTTGGQVCDDAGGTAACVDTCDDDPSCVGAVEGDLSCSGFFLNECTDTDADGCLDLVQTNCSPALCDDTGTPTACGVVTATGDTCADPIPVLATGFSMAGADFTADFADDEVLTDTSCITRPAGSVDAVFSVELTAGDVVAVAEFGGLDSTRNIQTSCGGAGACMAAQDDPDTGAITYTATGTETVFIVVEAFSSAPSTTDYAIAIDINPTCGNGTVELGEVCDDGDVDTGDGCADDCTVELGFDCAPGSPTVCTPWPDLGTLGDGDTTTQAGGALTAGASELYTVTFSEDVMVTGTLTDGGAADVDLFVYSADGAFLTAHADDLDETIGMALFAGSYILEVNAFSGGGDSTGHTLDIAASTLAVSSIGSFAVGDTIPDTTGGALIGRIFDHYTVTFTEDVLVSGTLGGNTTGEVGIRLYDATGLPLATFVAGDETFTDVPVSAGTYVVQILTATAALGGGDVDGYTLTMTTSPPPVCGNSVLESGEACDDGDTDTGDGCDDVCAVEFGYECDGGSPSTCTSFPSLGSFAPADAISDVVTSDVLTAGDSDFYLIELTGDVLLSGTLAANSTGDMDLYVFDSTNTQVASSLAFGDETFTDISLSAGTYVLEINAYSGDADAATGYTLTMSTATP
jgi:cysteine-rich repeat protein